jgi:hypothetical protein
MPLPGILIKYLQYILKVVYWWRIRASGALFSRLSQPNHTGRFYSLSPDDAGLLICEVLADPEVILCVRTLMKRVARPSSRTYARRRSQP